MANGVPIKAASSQPGNKEIWQRQYPIAMLAREKTALTSCT